MRDLDRLKTIQAAIVADQVALKPANQIDCDFSGDLVRIRSKGRASARPRSTVEQLTWFDMAAQRQRHWKRSRTESPATNRSLTRADLYESQSVLSLIDTNVEQRPINSAGLTPTCGRTQNRSEWTKSSRKILCTGACTPLSGQTTHSWLDKADLHFLVSQRETR